MLKKCLQISIFMTTLIFARGSLAEPPNMSWGTKYTGLSTQGACFRKVERAMRYYSFNSIRTSGRSGFYAKYGNDGVYILCRKNGSQAYVFCGGRRAFELCKRLGRYMED